MIDLTRDFRVYAADVPDQHNSNKEFQLNSEDNSCGKWMYEIMSRFGIRNAFLVTFSWRVFISLKILAFDESRIKRAFLISPAGIVNGNPLKIFWKAFLPVKMYKIKKKKKYVHRLLSELFTEKDVFTEAFYREYFLRYKMNFWSISLMDKKEIQKITMPVHIFAADNDLSFPGRKMIKKEKVNSIVGGYSIIEKFQTCSGQAACYYRFKIHCNTQ